MDRTTSLTQLPLANPAHETVSVEDLPREIAVDIFSRLPVKALIRSTAVKKSWYFLIRNPKFVQSHIARSISHANSNEHFMLLSPVSISPQNSVISISEDTFLVREEIKVPFTTERTNTLKIVGSVNGLLCLTDGDPSHHGWDLFLWNPSIRRYKPLLSSCYKKPPIDDPTKYSVIGLGFHEPTNGYRVVRMIYKTAFLFNCAVGFRKAPVVEVFSLRRNTWRKIRNADVPLIADREDCISVNGTIYWVEAKFPNMLQEFISILSFDLNIEAFREVKGPDNYRNWVGREARYALMEFKGSVSLCVYNYDNGVSQRCCVWVMSHEGGAVSWTRQFQVEFKENFGLPVNFTNSGILVIAPVCRDGAFTKLVLCDLKSLQYKDLGNVEPSTVATAFFECLVLLQDGSALSRDTD